MYCSPGFVDGEDGEGNTVRGSWREDEGSSSKTSVAMTSSNRYLFWIMSSVAEITIPPPSHAYRYSRSAAETRTSFKDYSNSAAGEGQGLQQRQERHLKITLTVLQERVKVCSRDKNVI